MAVSYMIISLYKLKFKMREYLNQRITLSFPASSYCITFYPKCLRVGLNIFA
jgi:hypothetical protein